LGHPWETRAECCGKHPTAKPCRYNLQLCGQLYDSKYDDQRDDIDDFDFPQIEDIGQETFNTAAEFCKTVCKNMDDEPDWCDNVPTTLSAALIAAIVLACVLFVALVGIVVLAIILWRKKAPVGGGAGG
jgi:hypothetical protein